VHTEAAAGEMITSSHQLKIVRKLPRIKYKCCQQVRQRHRGKRVLRMTGQPRRRISFVSCVGIRATFGNELKKKKKTTKNK
jgi:hypothetical protein